MLKLDDNKRLAYLSELEEIEIADFTIREKYIRLKQILDRCSKEITQTEFLQFSSLFARLVYIAQQYDFPPKLEWQLQNIRKCATTLLKDKESIIELEEYKLAKAIIVRFLSFLAREQAIEEKNGQYMTNIEKLSLDCFRVQVLEIDRDKEILRCRSEILSGQDLFVRYNVLTVNDIFTSTIDQLWIGAQLNLIDCKVDDEGNYIPKIFVLEPDYLIDASSLAECFQSYGSSYLHYFRRRLEPAVNTHYILLGNLANFFLDELIYAEDIENTTFEEVFLKSFRSMPFEYASCKDIEKKDDFIQFMVKANIHFDNIKRVILYDLPANGFSRSQCILEPSFFSVKYGFQGRLDLLQLRSKEDDKYRIIELKSGKPPYPQYDPTKVGMNHEAQTVVYRLMIQSVFNCDARHVYPTILYSSAEKSGENIRLAARYQQLEKEIINTRNLIVATEHHLYAGDGHIVEQLLTNLFEVANYDGRVPQFFVDKLEELKKIFVNSSELEKAYFYRFINFLSRELYLQKTGDEAYNSSMSISALWNTTFADRKEALELMSDLEIEEIDNSGRGMTIRFSRKSEDDFVNFREGDICILYPCHDADDTILTNQILKGTVAEIVNDTVLLRFRYKQRNSQFFERYRYWAIEHDKLDNTYVSMYRGMFDFLRSDKDKKNLLLGLRQPQSKYIKVNQSELSKEEKQQIVIEKALAAEDYFLIVGPPGTGKTSIFARQLIEQLYSAKDQNILVIAYTNRAVDELCSAIESALENEGEDKSNYIRIGSELSCAEEYQSRLLQNISAEVRSRRELLDILKSSRIFVGTLASIVGRPELFDIKRFDVAIIDEASQILEPQIIGLLPKFGKFIMIGDHKQLSTITLQDEMKSKVEDEILNTINLYDCRESLFERLYRICNSNNWTDSYDTLTYHGRMHQEIAELVNSSFYDGMLRVAEARQTQGLSYSVYDRTDFYQSLLVDRRVGFIPVRKVDYSNLSDKINEHEADEIVALAKAVYALCQQNGLLFDPVKTVGIIAPYRNQIALIKHKLEKSGIEELKQIMVDTVERYQGSQRDVIFVSFCFNRPYQMNFFSNMDREGKVDRKLNVALTRAREQLFLVGNDYIMQQKQIYRELLQHINRENPN